MQNDDDIPNWLDDSEYHRHFVIYFHRWRKFQHAMQMTDATNVKSHYGIRMISIRRHCMLKLPLKTKHVAVAVAVSQVDEKDPIDDILQHWIMVIIYVSVVSSE